MHFSGCSASCAQPQIADVGFRGAVAHVGNHLSEAVDIGLGGSLGTDSGFIDWVESARPVNDVPDAMLRLVRRYQTERRADEPFYNWARRNSGEDLRRTLSESGVGTPVTVTTKKAPTKKAPVNKKAASTKTTASKAPAKKATAAKATAKKASAQTARTKTAR